MNFSEHLVFLREKRKISQKELAKAIGISVHAYQRFEYGEQEPRLSVLVALADILLARFTPQGFVGRLGGDEFSIYMPGASRAGILRLAELTRRDIEEKSQRMHGFSCSMGMVRCTRSMEYGQSYKLADQALYKAKKTGKNCFVLAEAGAGGAEAGADRG